MNKTFVTLLITSVLISTTAYAHPRGPKGSPVEKLTEELNLDDVQANSIALIFENAKAECDDIDSRSEHRECMEEQHDQVDDQISGLLTEEQFEQFQEMKTRREERRSRPSR